MQEPQPHKAEQVGADERVYLDHNATTPPAPEVLDAMRDCWAKSLGNAHAVHWAGRQARRILDDARCEMLSLLGAAASGPSAATLHITMGATHSNAMLLASISSPSPPVDRRLVTSAIEHPSILRPAERLLEAGWEWTTLPVSPAGVVDLDRARDLIGDHAALVSVILVHHETGVVQPVGALAELASDRRVPLHTDATQALGRISLNFDQLGVQAMSFSAHKFGGPVGIGALVLRKDFLASPVATAFRDGSLETLGTPPVASVVGLKEALRLRIERFAEYTARLRSLQDVFEGRLRAICGPLWIHGDEAPRAPGTTHVAFEGVDARRLQQELDQRGVACSRGSACTSDRPDASPSLRAMGVPEKMARSTVRFSFAPTTPDAAIDRATAIIGQCVDQLRGQRAGR